MQLSSSQFDEERNICTYILECIQQPFEFRGIENLAVSRVNLNIVSQNVTAKLSQNLQELLPAKVVDNLMKSIYSKELQRVSRREAKSGESEEMKMNDIMKLFPEIQGDDPQLSEYSSLRNSIQSSICLFEEMKQELFATKAPQEEEWNDFYRHDQKANDLVNESKRLLSSLSTMVDEGTLERGQTERKRPTSRFSTTEDIFAEYCNKKKRV